jgi:hypothetical protein
MQMKWVIPLFLLTSLWWAPPAGGNENEPDVSFESDVSVVIERFMEKQFPEATSHFWVVNGTQWQAEQELIIDVNTIVTSPAPVEHRFLLLVVAGKLAAAQNIPLDAKPDCQSEST